MKALVIYATVCVFSSAVLVAIDRRGKAGESDRLSGCLGHLALVQPLMALGMFNFPVNFVALLLGIGFDWAVLEMDRRIRPRP